MDYTLPAYVVSLGLLATLKKKKNLWSYEANFYSYSQLQKQVDKDRRTGDVKDHFWLKKYILCDSYTCLAKQISIQNSKKWIQNTWKKAFEGCLANFPR